MEKLLTEKAQNAVVSSTLPKYQVKQLNFFLNHFSSILASGVKVVFPIRGNPSKDLNFPQSNLHKLHFLAKYIEII